MQTPQTTTQTPRVSITLHIDQDVLVFIGCLLAGLVCLKFAYLS